MPAPASLLRLASVLMALGASGGALACTAPVSVCAHDQVGSLALIRGGRPVAVLVDAGADPAVRHAAEALAGDLGRVAGRPARLVTSPAGFKGPLVVIGVAGTSPTIDALVRAGKVPAADLAGQWEAYRQLVIEHPFPGVPRALVIVGSDRRGAAFGAYDLSDKIGVSPWHWWADVPVARRADLFVTAGARRDQPRIKYRGFFINDEDPAFGTWVKANFGGANHRAYAQVFDLLLRLKGNYLWPAMWEPRAFNADDPENMVLADSMGVVMGTSHHEPMTRAHAEWDRDPVGGKWDYAVNAANLRRYWRGGIERLMSKGDGRGYEAIVTVGMRGDGDEAMSEGTATKLLETIVADQRRIIADVTGKPAERTPQMWALYKEVQDYYDAGMRVPDDVTLLFSDDNWGQIRRLPEGGDERAGGSGVYYHFDYVGGPRNYKWLNTNQIEKTWQQMDLAWQRGARQLWIVNVGDIKPMEFPLSFFMAQAWDPAAMTPAALADYPRDWAANVFGPANGEAIGELVTRYSRYAARRKPELIDAAIFPLGAVTKERLDGGEFGSRIAEWDRLGADMRRTGRRIDAPHRAAWFQLVEHPIRAMATLYRLHYAVAWNRRLAAAGDPRANAFADMAEAAFAQDRALAAEYHALEGGKWDGMMLQTHIGYSGWQQPPADVMPAVTRVPGKAPPLRFVDPSPPATIEIEAVGGRASPGAGLTWAAIPHLGHGAGAMVSLPQGRPATTQADKVTLTYDVTIPNAGAWTLGLVLAPTLDIDGHGGRRIGVSLDDGPMQTLTDRLEPAPTAEDTAAKRAWSQAVIGNARTLETSLPAVAAGRHRIALWRLDDNVVPQKLVLRRP